MADSAAGERFWEADLDEDERKILGLGKSRVELSPRVLVVGGGIMGVVTALACADAGMGPIQLVEAATLGSGATGGSAGLLQPETHHGKDAAALVDLARVSLERWRQIDAATPGGLGLVDHDWIGLAERPEWAERPDLAAGPPPTLRPLDADEVARRLPALARPDGWALIPDQARLNPLRALARLAGRLEHVATGVAADAVRIEGRRLTEVTSSAGTFHPDVVVFATGVPPAVSGLDLALPADRIKGHLLVTEPLPPTEAGDLTFSGTVDDVATRLEDGRLLAGGTLDLDDESPAVDDAVIDGIRGRLTRALPAAAGLTVTHRWCCWRPHHPDDLPVIDRLPGLDNAWITSGHYRTGVLLAPATADILVEWIQTGRQPEAAAPFSLARFA